LPEAVAATVDRFDKLDILVNHAGEQHPTAGIEEISATQLERGGVIINTSSVTAYRGSTHLIDYAASNGAITAFTRSLAKALVERGIRVNSVAPGPIWTPLIPASFDPDEVAAFGTNTPMGRAGQPAE